jgi:hypothetical protein
VAKLASTWTLVKAALRQQRRSFGSLLLVAAIVTIPGNLIALLASTETTVSTYVSVASIVMNLAIVWTVVQLDQGQPVKASQAYYDGTATFVKFVLLSLLLIVAFLPLALGLILYSVGVIGAAPGTTIFEKSLLTVLAALLAAPSILWVNRLIFSPFILVASGQRPLAAARLSWRSVKGHSWQVLVRLLGLILAVAILIAIPALLCLYFYAVTKNRGWLVLLQIFSSLLLLPFIDLYLYKLYRSLK